jgi:hypothetical protein
MHREIFTIPVIVATVLLVLHSYLFRGPRSTLVFWGAGYCFAFLRELAYQNWFPTYRFVGADLKLLNVPLTIPAGWLFEAYTSLYLAQFILGMDLRALTEGAVEMTPERYGRRVLPVLALSSVVTGTIACAIENVAVKMHWWQARSGGEDVGRWITGHMYTVFWLLTLLVYVTHRELRLVRNLVYVACALGFTAVMELANVIGPYSRDHAWAKPLAFAVAGAYVLSVFMYRRLLLFFAVVVGLGILLDPSEWLASFLQINDSVLVWQVWVIALISLYGLHMYLSQRPTAPARPVVLV